MRLTIKRRKPGKVRDAKTREERDRRAMVIASWVIAVSTVVGTAVDTLSR
jgi:hypothetical protein